MAPKYIVEYRQVNINVGDCSFVLLVEDEIGKDPIIKRAVMIDGGDGGDIRIKNIRRVMERIENLYRLPKGHFKLDAMIITHWDCDHYFGVLKLLDDDLMATNTSQVSFLKYDLTSGAPLSILYIPYEDSDRAKASYKIDYSPSSGEFLLTTSDGRQTRVCKYLADMPLEKRPILNGNPKELATGDISKLIGRDLFTNHRPALAKVISAADPKALVNAHTATMPGLYCVAANNRYLKGKKTTKKLAKNISTITNRSSIICMVIRPNGTASHYLAGDADRDLEAKVIDWTGLEPATPGSKPTLQQRIAIVKASHHGSAKSTPITLCQTYKPMFFVFSSGDKHRHPTWETLLYVYSYYISPLGHSISPLKGGRYEIYTTSYPYWLDNTKVIDSELFNKDDPLTKTSRAAKLYRDTISSFFDSDPSSAELNIVDKFTNPKRDNMTKKLTLPRADWIRRHVDEVVLSRFSVFNDTSYACLPSTSADESELAGRVSSIRILSDDNQHLVFVDMINVTVYPMPVNTTKSLLKISRKFTAPRGNNTDTKFYLLSSEAVDPPSQSVNVPASWDLFVSTLSHKFIILADELGSTSKKVDLHEEDEWQAWFASAINPEVRVSVTGSVADKVLTIDHFSLTVLKATFSPSRKVGPKNDPKFDPAADLLRFDIDASSPSSIKFGDLYEFFGVGGDSIAFASDIVLQLDKNSAVWFSPLVGNYTSAIRLEASAVFKPEEIPATVSFLKNLGGLGLWGEIVPSKITAIAKKKVTTVGFESPRENVTDPEIILSFDFPSFSTTISCGANSYTLAIYWKQGAFDAMAEVFKKITGSSSVSDGFKEVVDKISSGSEILRLLVEIHRNDKDSKFTLGKIGIDAQLKSKFGKASSETKDVIFMLSFVWPDLIFKGSLYVPDTVDHSWKKLLPSYEEIFDVKPTVDPSNIASNLSLLDLIPGNPIDTPPQGIPILISSAMIEVDKTSFILQGVMKAVPPPPDSHDAFPSVSFDSLKLNLSYAWGKSPRLYIAALISLHPPPAGSTDPPPEPDCPDSPGFLLASVKYENKKWTLAGTLMNINFGDLAIFFHAEEKGQVVDVLGNVNIRSLVVNCEYGGKGEPTQFKFEGTIEIAALELDFEYNRNSDDWTIIGGLSAAKECTVADVIHSICGDDAKNFDIPDFIGDVKLNVEHDPKSHEVPQDSPVYLKCSKPSSKNVPLVSSFRFRLGKIQLSFIQISNETGATLTKKCVLIFSLAGFLPSFQIPVVGHIDNPVDGLEYIWVQDKSETAGLTRSEVVEINKVVFDPEPGILFKDLKTDVVLTAGCHFMLLVNDSGNITAALDYKFAAPKKQVKVDSKNKDSEDEDSEDEDSEHEVSEDEYAEIEDSENAVATPNSDPPVDSNAGGMSKAAVHKTIGPLSLSNIGLQYKDLTIIITLDASLTLGPIGVELLGFGLGLRLTSTIFSSPKLPDFSFQLRGLGAALDKPPIILAGLFEDLSNGQTELFAGGIAISMKEYSFLALGSYGVVIDPSGGKFKTFFLFAQLQGPLVELEFASINGVSLGFGYNSHVKYPSVDQVSSFPLVKGISSKSADDAASSSNVLTVLSDGAFTNWVTPQNDSLWFAAGLEVLAFETLDVRAVAIIEIDPFVSAALFADAVCSLPPMVPRDVCFVYVELGINCRVDTRYGIFSVEGKLSPNSFVLHPSCHLLGGFALYYWFDPSSYAGEFVCTVGGYHPAYRPPSYYPQPQRLTITWQLDSTISITGESFFAITPKVCMGGGSLSILFQSGAIRAHLDAYASFLMAWNPFHFMGDIGVSVGVGFHGKILFWTYNIEIDISASLHLEGPPFGGNVHVDFWLFGFNIYFGSNPSPPPPLSLDEFWNMLSRSSNKPDTGHDVGITLGVESGYAQGKSKQVTPKPGEPWIIAVGQFNFNIQCRFAVHTVKYNSDSILGESEVLVYSKPMYTTEKEPMESSLKITITSRMTAQNVGGFTFRPLTKNVPSAMWGQYNPANDPSHGTSPDDLLDGNNSTIKDVWTGVHIMSPTAEYPKENIPPFNAHDAMFIDIIKDARFPVGIPSPQSKAWLPTATNWEGAKNGWTSPAETAKRVANEWTEVFGWKDKLVGRDKLVGSPPAILVKNFEDFYLSVPGITSA